jgi:hypothetical protein
MSSSEIGVGLIGAGWMGSLHAQAYRRVGDHYPELPLRPRLVVAADTDPGKAETARAMGFETFVADPLEVIGHPDQRRPPRADPCGRRGGSPRLDREAGRAVPQRDHRGRRGGP